MEFDNMNNDIAIVGISCRVPKANNIDEFWENLKNGTHCITTFTDEELLKEGIDPELLKNPDYVKSKGIIEDIEYFDAAFFGITPREAAVKDPQQRLMLESSWEALENAGYDPEKFDGKIGVYYGSSLSFYMILNLIPEMKGKSSFETLQAAIGNDKDSLPTTIAYNLNLKGPAMSVQSSSSSSLVSVAMACQSLLSYQCDMALSGGIAIFPAQKRGYLSQEGGISSKDGHTRTFDAESSGFVPGSGLGVVVLKRLEDAIEDKDQIYAVIKGVAVNNDGSSKMNYSAPSVEGQIDVVSEAHAISSVHPDTISYVEAHGTGTKIGDPIELEALTKAFRLNTERKGYCGIGSVKSNLGHLDTAAGVTGLIKTALSLYNKQLPPTINLRNPNPNIDFENSPFYVNTQLKDWQTAETPRRAGVSSIGMGGTNAHAILEEAPTIAMNLVSREYQSLLLSAKTENALKSIVNNYINYFNENENVNLADVSYTSKVGRKELDKRLAIVFKTKDEIVKKLERFAGNSKMFFSVANDFSKNLVFIFAGQSKNDDLVFSELYTKEIAFKTIADKCFETLGHITNESIKSEIENELINPESNKYYSIIRSFILEYSLAEMFYEWGIISDVNIGAGFGEFSSACYSGIISLDDTLKILLLCENFKEKNISKVQLLVQQGEDELKKNLPSNVSIIAKETSNSTIVSGNKDDIDYLEEELFIEGIICEKVDSYSYMEYSNNQEFMSDYTNLLKQIEFNKPKIPFIAGWKGEFVEEDQINSTEIWENIFLEPNKLKDSIEILTQEENSIFFEIGANKKNADYIKNQKHEKFPIISFKRVIEDTHTVLYNLVENVGMLWREGIKINWEKYYEHEERCRIPLPTYPFERKRFWIDAPVDEYKDTTHENINKNIDNVINNKNEIAVNQREDLITEYKAPETDTEKTLVTIWESILGVKQIGIDDDFFELGGQSLTATILISKILKEINVKVSIKSVFKNASISKLALLLDNLEKQDYLEEILDISLNKIPVASAQSGMFLLQKFDEKSTGYNVPITQILRGNLDKSKLEDCFNILIQRHENMRSSFFLENDKIFQKVHENAELKIENIKYSNDFNSVIHEFIRPFNLNEAPLFRVGIMEIGNNEHLLIIDVHHIIADGISMGIMSKEFIDLYKGVELEHVNNDFNNFHKYINSSKYKINIENQKKFWLEKYSESVPKINLPTDYARPKEWSYNGKVSRFSFDKETLNSLNNIVKEDRFSLFAILLSAYYILLSRIANQNDISVGVVNAGRKVPNSDKIVGMLVNTLCYRCSVNSDLTFSEFLKMNHKDSLNCLENQEYPYEDLVSNVVDSRELNRNPIFDVMFVFQNFELPNIEIPGISSEMYSTNSCSAKVDIAFIASEVDEQISFMVEYATDLFHETSIKRFFGYYKEIISSIIKNKNIKLKDINILSESENEKLNVFSNGLSLPHDSKLTIHNWFERLVNKNEDKVAVIFQDQLLSYFELDKRATQLSRKIIEIGIKPGEIVSILMERSVELVIAILGVMKAGCAYLPIDTEYPEERKKLIVEDSESKLILVNSEEEIELFQNKMDNRIILDLRNELSFSSNIDTELPEVTGTDLVYVIYTSGSTGKPKGVKLRHENLVNLMHFMFNNSGIDCKRILQFATIGFDASFHEIFSALLCSGTIVMVDKETRANIPVLLSYINKNDIVTLFLPISFIRSIFNEDSFIELFPKSIKHIQSGGDQVIISSKFKQYIKQNGINVHNHYGPAETHGVVAYTVFANEEIPYYVPIGKPILNTQIYIVDEDFNKQPINVIGDLLIGGIQVGDGYLYKEDLTKEKFIKNPFGGESILYQTGDLAKWLPDGNIEFCGRSDNQVKIRGYRVEVSEIEEVIRKIDNVKEVLVKVNEKNTNEKSLHAYVIKENNNIDAEEINEYIEKNLPSYMIPSSINFIDEFPLSPNKKIDYNKLPAPGIVAEKHQPATTEFEFELVELFSKILDIKDQEFGVNSDFFSLGGNSLKSIMLSSHIYKKFNVKIPQKELFRSPTIKAIAYYISNASKIQYFSIPAVNNENNIYELSFSQRRFYFLQSLNFKDVTYNLVNGVLLNGSIDIEFIENVIIQLINRHDSFRTSFETEDNKVIQRIKEKVDFKIDLLSYSENISIDQTIIEYNTPFDLSKAPLIKVGLQHRENNQLLMVLCIHHIISDGVSADIFINEIMSIFAGKTLAKNRLQYKDYAEWQQSNIESDLFLKQKKYWLNKFSKEIPEVSIPTDFVRPEKMNNTGSILFQSFTNEQIKQIDFLVDNNKVTHYILLLSIFKILIHKYSGCSELIIGTPVSGRTHSDLEDIIGVLINMVAIKSTISKEMSFSDFLNIVKEDCVNSFDNQDYPFDELIKALGLQGNVNKNPIFNIAFLLADGDKDLSKKRITINKNVIEIEPHKLSNIVSRFDMLFGIIKIDNNLSMEIEYSTELFKESTIKMIIRHFEEIIRQVSENEEIKIDDIELSNTIDLTRHKQEEISFDF